MSQNPAEALEPYRRYLMVLAELHLDRRLRGKLDASDVVQQTMLRALSAFEELRSQKPEVLTAWLRKILASALADAVKHFERDKRDINLERSIEADIDKSASGLELWLAADQSSPSQIASRNEELFRLVDALSQLPDRMRDVVVAKYCRGGTLQRTADEMKCTVPAVASLLRRGLENLRRLMNA